MKKIILLGMLFAASVCNAQVVLWNGEDKELKSHDGFWNRADPVVIEETPGGNKCLKITLKAANPGDWPDEHRMAALDLAGVNLQGLRRISMRIKMAKNHNVLVKLTKEGDGGYTGDDTRRWAWYDGEGDGESDSEWRTLVYEYGDGPNSENIVETGNTLLEIYPYEFDDEWGQVIYIDDIQLEGPLADGTAVRTLSDDFLTGDVTLTGLMGKGNYQCTWDGAWHNVSYDDYAMLNSKLSSGITSVDATRATLNDFDADQFFYKNVNNVLYAPTGTSGSHANVVVDGVCGNLNLNAGYAFNAPSGFTVTGSVNIFRTTRAGINSFCLPVEVSEGDLMFKDDDPDPLANYLATYKETGEKVVFTKHATVAANTPFILDSKYAVTESNYITIDCSENNKTVVATPDPLGTTFVGVYIPLKPGEVTDKWGINNEGKLQMGGESATINAFHAYLELEYVPDPDAREITIDDGEVTGIVNVKSLVPAEECVAFDLQGRQVAQPTRGLYIVNGKKVVIK